MTNTQKQWLKRYIKNNKADIEKAKEYIDCLCKRKNKTS